MPAAPQDEAAPLDVGADASAPEGDGDQQLASSSDATSAGAAGAAAGDGSGGEGAEEGGGLKGMDWQPPLVSPPGSRSPASLSLPPVVVADKGTLLPGEGDDAGRSYRVKGRCARKTTSRGGRGRSRGGRDRAGEGGASQASSVMAVRQEQACCRAPPHVCCRVSQLILSQRLPGPRDSFATVHGDEQVL